MKNFKINWIYSYVIYTILQGDIPIAGWGYPLIIYNYKNKKLFYINWTVFINFRDRPRSFVYLGTEFGFIGGFMIIEGQT